MNDVFKGDVSVEFQNQQVSSRVTVDIEGSWVKASSCAAVGSKLLLGADAESTVGTGMSTFKAYSLGAATGGPNWGASLTCTNKLQTYNASAFYIVKPTVVASVLASCTPERSENRCGGVVGCRLCVGVG